MKGACKLPENASVAGAERAGNGAQEKRFVMCAIILGAFLYAYIIGDFSSLIANMSQVQTTRFCPYIIVLPLFCTSSSNVPRLLPFLACPRP